MPLSVSAWLHSRFMPPQWTVLNCICIGSLLRANGIISRFKANPEKPPHQLELLFFKGKVCWFWKEVRLLQTGTESCSNAGWYCALNTMRAKVLAINKTACNKAHDYALSSGSHAETSSIISDWGRVLDDDIWPLALPRTQNHWLMCAVSKSLRWWPPQMGNTMPGSKSRSQVFPCWQIQAKALFPFHQHSAWEWNVNKTEEVRRPTNCIRGGKMHSKQSWTLGNSPKACSLPAPSPCGWPAALRLGFRTGGTTKLLLPPGAPPKDPGMCG